MRGAEKLLEERRKQRQSTKGNVRKVKENLKRKSESVKAKKVRAIRSNKQFD